MVLFPRRAGQPKQGQVNDAAEEEANVAQVTTRGALAVVQESMKVPAMSPTPEHKNLKAYQHMRTEMMHAKWWGKRIARAKEEA